MELFFSLLGNERLGIEIEVCFCCCYRWMGCGVGLVFTFLFWHLQDLGGSPTLFGEN
jgi:hypothetical protein